MQKEQKGNIVGLVFGVIIVTAIIALYVGTHIDLMFKEPQDLIELISEEGEPVKDAYVSLEVDAVVECYAETKHRINGIIPAGTDRHYILWLTDGSFISLQAKGKKDIEALDKIMDQTYDALFVENAPVPDTYELTGVISTMDSEIQGYYRQTLNLWGIDTTVGQIYYVQLDETQTKLSSWLMMGFFVVIDIICIIALVSSIKESKEQKAVAKASVMSAPITDENNNLYS